jgi:hypothetical protein
MFKPLAIVSLSVVLPLLPSAHAGRQTAAEAKRQNQYDDRIGYGDNAFNEVFRAAARVDVRKPIREYEAYVLASAYLFSQVSLCGRAYLPTRRGDVWVAETTVGYPPSAGRPIYIDARTGITYAAGFPRIVNPKKYLKSLQNI